MTDLVKEFWNRMDDVRAGMLGVKGHGRLIPMAPQVDDDVPGHIWFITAQGTELANAVATGPQAAQFVVTDDKAGLYADIDGMLTLSADDDALDEVWSGMAAAWFEDGKADDDVRLMKFTPSAGEVSLTEGGVKFLYEIAKANLTRDTPDYGAQGPVTF